LAPVIDLERETAHAPVRVALEGCVARIDLLLDLLDQRRAALLRDLRIEQHEQVICGRRRHRDGEDSRWPPADGANPCRLAPFSRRCAEFGGATSGGSWP